MIEAPPSRSTVFRARLERNVLRISHAPGATLVNVACNTMHWPYLDNNDLEGAVQSISHEDLRSLAVEAIGEMVIHAYDMGLVAGRAQGNRETEGHVQRILGVDKLVAALELVAANQR